MAHLQSITSLTFKPKSRWHRVGHNTKFYSSQYGSWEMRYHRTKVVSFDGAVLYVSHGGWATKTTAERIRHALSYFGLTLLTNDLPNVWRVADTKGNAWTIRGNQLSLIRDNNNNWRRAD